MKGITEIDEQAALLLVRAYKAAYQSEGPRIRSEVWQNIAHQLNKQNTRNLTVTQWKKRISNIKSLVKLKSDMERRGRGVNWTNIEREYLRLFPNLAFDDDSSSLSGGASNSITNILDEDQTLGEDDLLDEMDEEAPATMVKTENKWTSDDLRRTLLEAHKHFLMSSVANAASTSTSGGANSNTNLINTTPTITTTSSELQSIKLPTTNSHLNQAAPKLSSLINENLLKFQLPQALASNQTAPFLDLRSIVSQMDSTQRKQSMLTCLRNFRQQIDLFTELLEQDLALNGQTF